MKQNLNRLEAFWGFSDTWEKSNENDISSFEEKYDVLIPDDLKLYFTSVNGSGPNWDGNLMTFYPLDEVKSIREELINYGSSPNYTNLSNTLNDYENNFVFADYSLNVFTYAIKLYKEPSLYNEVYVINGDEYKIVANSFNEFIELYLKDFHLTIF